MTELLTAAQMRAIEQAAIESGKVTGLELMERAGKGVLDAVREHWPELFQGPMRDPQGDPLRRAVILCGPGNNGGDGFVIARLFAEQGWDVLISLYGDPNQMPPDAKFNYERWRDMGSVVCRGDYESTWDWFEDALDLPNDVFVDALFGTGMTRPIPEEIECLTGYIGEKRKGSYSRVVAVDIPTGLHADTGAVLGHDDTDDAMFDMQEYGKTLWGFRAISADLTVTFHAKKKGHLLGHGPWMCGKIVTKSIGL